METYVEALLEEGIYVGDNVKYHEKMMLTVPDNHRKGGSLEHTNIKSRLSQV
jgi:hypothetical protein